MKLLNNTINQIETAYQEMPNHIPETMTKILKDYTIKLLQEDIDRLEKEKKPRSSWSWVRAINEEIKYKQGLIREI